MISLDRKWGRITLFEEYGFGFIFQPHWSIYFLVGFIGINIQLNRGESVSK